MQRSELNYFNSRCKILSEHLFTICRLGYINERPELSAQVRGEGHILSLRAAGRELGQVEFGWAKRAEVFFKQTVV